MFELVLFSHVLGAIVAVGPALTYGVWLALARQEDERVERFAFKGVLWLDSHLVTPAFGWQLVSGLLLVYVFGVASFRQAWLAWSFGIYLVVFVVALTLVAPRARRAARALDEAGTGAEAYRSYRSLMRRLSPLISLATLVIVFLMVVKP